MTCNKINYYTCMYHYFWKLCDCFWLRSLNHIYRYIESMNLAVPGRVWVICQFRFLRCLWLFVRFAGLWHVFTCQVFQVEGERFLVPSLFNEDFKRTVASLFLGTWLITTDKYFFPCQFIIWELKEISKSLALWGMAFPMWE